MIEPGDSVVVELAEDLAGGVRNKPIRITASDEIGHEAAEYWRRMLASSGVIVLGALEGEREGCARIHLHDRARTATTYSATGLTAAELSRDLVGEVIGRGDSAGDRYSWLTAVADALIDALTDDESLAADPTA